MSPIACKRVPIELFNVVVVVVGLVVLPRRRLFFFVLGVSQKTGQESLSFNHEEQMIDYTPPFDFYQPPPPSS